MADTSSHLEKMGRELKCPICLDLLHSSVSLSCNHVFCNVCIHKSMKSGSDCPVCKMPFRRREIRPAPHMDNLVSIYKNMEVASGIPLFVTQDESTIKLDGKRQNDGNLDPSREKIGEDASPKDKLHQKAENSKKSESKAKNAGRNRGKSSFSMNKRVQVPQSPSNETPLRQAKEDLEKQQANNKVMNNSLAQNKVMNNSVAPAAPNSEHQLSNAKESPGLAPFFWLRDDDDAEKSSQQTDEDQLTCTPANVPTFSDLKDSDDDVPIKAPIRKCVNVELFDSEMFEWTQRPCSPELCPSPLKMQVEERGGCKTIPETEIEAPSDDAVKEKEITAEQLDNINPREMNNNRNKIEHGSCPRSSDHTQIESKMPQKRGCRGNKRKEVKRRKISLGKHLDKHECSDATDFDFEQGQKSENNSALVSSKSRDTSKSRSFSSPDILISDKADKLDVSKTPDSVGSERGTRVCNTLGMARSSKRIKKSNGSDLGKTCKQKVKVAKADGNGELTASEDKEREESVGKLSKSQASSSHKSKRSSKPVKTKTAERICVDNNLLQKMFNETKGFSAEAAIAQNKIHEASKVGETAVPLKTRRVHLEVDMPSLRKCNTSSLECAFCLKSEETEASGEMLHYVQGKPVPVTHKGDSVIHSHKNCAEWAPNVYFEDDIAVNLEEELARSRRIKCSLCGVKGAALGCYEKSCRKSFHVPCAKRLRECRWDTDHFVILCPLHISSKLPCEMSISQVSQVKKGRCNVNGKFLNHQPQFPVKCSNSRWSCGRSSEKIILCGSALTTDEKEAVSEFAKSSGVALLANWKPTITHVIASTIENGACKRTLKVLKGILEGKWILSIKWVQACMKASKLVEETPYEISSDIYGIKNGPRLGRLRLLNKQPKLFSGFKFYLTGDFKPSYMSYLQDLVTTAGGTILHRKPIAEDSGISKPSSSVTLTFIIYAEQPDKCLPSRKDLTLECRRSDAEALARSSGARVAHDTWVFDCIAGHMLQGL